jgi:hypothetical protein
VKKISKKQLRFQRRKNLRAMRRALNYEAANLKGLAAFFLAE